MPTLTLASSIPASATAVDVPVSTAELRKLPAADKKVAKLQRFEAKAGQTLVMAGGDGPVRVLVGLGAAKDIEAGTLRKAAAAYIRAVRGHATVACTMAAGVGKVDAADAVAAVAEGVSLVSYRFTGYKSDPATDDLKKVVLVASGRGLKDALARAVAATDAVNLARDLGNTPGGDLTPEAFVAAARKALRGTGVRATVWDEAKIAEERLGGLLAVNQGSTNPPRFLTLNYKPKGRKPKASVALVGKGVTFDSGGLSIKTFAGMVTMKIDMAGAAAMLAATSALSAVDAPVEVTTYIPLTDNMINGDAWRPGDIFTARNGKTVEVLNTDAEGRLILADALSLAAEGGHDAIIDAATLTGSATAALGTAYVAMMSSDDKLATRLETSAAATGEQIWRLPLPAEYRPQLDSNIADLRNIGKAPYYGGAMVAALFLQEFAGTGPWAHLDLGMSAISDTDRGFNPPGATGVAVRLLIDLLANW
jgi:leucyl aminopeptidase